MKHLSIAVLLHSDLVDGVPKDAKYLFRLYMARKQYKDLDLDPPQLSVDV